MSRSPQAKYYFVLLLRVSSHLSLPTRLQPVGKHELFDQF